jgi:hypothetical protein
MPAAVAVTATLGLALGGGQGARAWSIVHQHRLTCRELERKPGPRARSKHAPPCRSGPLHLVVTARHRSPPTPTNPTTLTTTTSSSTTPPPPTTTTTTPPPTGPSTRGCDGCSWNGDFSTDDWSQYNNSPAYHPDGNSADYGLVSGPTPPGFAHAFEATTTSGTGSIVSGEDGERTLLDLFPEDGGTGSTGLTHAYQGASTWYRDEIYFPASFQPSRNSDFSWVYQLHNYPDSEGDAMLQCGVDTGSDPYGPFSDGGGVGANPSPERFSCRIFGGGSPTYPFNKYTSANWYKNPAVDWDYIVGLHTVPTGQWLDMVWHIDWDWRSTASGGQGGMQWWINGQQVGSYAGPTLLYLSNAPGYSAGGANQAYLTDGYYRDTDADAGYAQPTASVYHGATMLGPTAASIGESLP